MAGAPADALCWGGGGWVWARSTEWLELDDAVAGAESVIRREINLRRLAAAAWNADDSSFKRPCSHARSST